MRTSLILLCWALGLPLCAQRISRTYHDVPLSQALRELNGLQSRVRINFIYDELEDFKVSAALNRTPVVDAVHRLVGFYPIRVTQIDSVLLVECMQKTAPRYKGRILDEAMQPAEYANITLLSPADSAVLARGVSNESGYFVIPCEAHEVVARVTYVGYKPVQCLVREPDMGTIRLQPEVTTFKGVTVRGSRPQYKATKGGMSVVVENSLLSTLGTASDVLNQLPRVSFDRQTGKATVFAKGDAEVYINNKKVKNAADLTRLKATDIQQVDILTSPGAQYNAEVGAVIRIKTIRRQGEGVSVSNSSNLTVGHKTGGYDDLTVRYQHRGLEVFGNTYFSNRWFGEDNHLATRMTIGGQTLDVKEDLIDGNRSDYLSGQAGFSLDLDSNHSFGATYTINKDLFTHTFGHGFYNVFRNGSHEGTVDVRYDGTIPSGPGHEADLYYIGKIGRLGIDFNGSYVRNRTISTQYVGENSATLGNREAHTHAENRSRMLAAKIILSCPLGAAGTLGWGSEVSHTKTSGAYEIAEGYVDNSQTDTRERNIAGFATWEMTLKAWSFSAGMRYEHVTADYFLFGIRQDGPSRRYGNWFPSASVAWNKGRWGAQLNYTEKTHRAYYYQLRNEKQYDNQYTYEGGNPSLDRSIIRNIEASMTWSWFNLTAGYAYIRHPIMWAYDLYTDQEIVFATNKNFPRKQTVNLSAVCSPQFGWYQPSLELMYYRQFFDSEQYGLGIKLARPEVVVKLRNRMRLSDTWSAIIGFGFDSYGDDDTSRGKAQWDMGGSMQKTFFHDALRLNLYVNDVFRTQKTDRTSYGTNAILHKEAYHYSRSVGLTVTYNLNASRSKYKGTGAGNEEKRRL